MTKSRRTFIKDSAMAVGLLPLLPFPSVIANHKISPNDRISFGVIGCNGMGFSNLKSLHKIPETQCLALCDVDQMVLDKKVAETEKLTGTKPQTYTDYRALLDNQDLDFVVIGTPDHWHCLMMVEALEAGKHVYVEKPIANSIQECDIMLAASQKHQKVVQVGQWQRSGPHWRKAMEFVHSGKLGNIRTVKTWAYQGWMKPVDKVPDGPVPPGVDYDGWLGPAPSRPFNQNRFHFNFRWFWDYAGGLMTDWGVHILDFALYGMKATYPKSVIATGGKFAYPNDASETPDTLQAVFEFDNFTMLWEHATGIDLGPYRRTHGVAFIGNNGTLVVDRKGWEVIPEDEPNAETKELYPKMAIPPSETRDGSDLDRHTVNFIDAMKTGAPLNASVAVAHPTAVVAHMGNIAYRTGRKIYWDREKNEFKQDKEANALIGKTYRSPLKLPKY